MRSTGRRGLSTGRRGLLLGFTAGVTVLATASAAFACTKYVGKVTLTANAPGSLIASAEANPVGVHGYCSGDQRQNVKIVGTFTLAVAPSASCGTSQLQNGIYEVLYVPVSTTTPAPVNNCNFDGLPLGPMTVNNGTGSGTYAMPTVGGAPLIGFVNICVAARPTLNPDTSQTGGIDSAPELLLNVI